jgi:hypothetical protein
MDAWDQQSLANSFSTMALTPPAATGWVTDSGASNHTTLDAGNLISVHPPTSIDPSSIVVGNGSNLLVTSVGDSTLPCMFYLNNVLVLLILFKIFYLFVVLPLTIGVSWSLTRLAFL